MPKNIKLKYVIGSWVTVTATTAFEYNEHGTIVTTREECEPWVGQVVGATYKNLGKRISGSSGFYGEDYDGPSFRLKGRVFVWLVKRGMMNKQIMVADGDIKPVENPENMELPWIFRKNSFTQEENQRYVQLLREEMSSWPRDKSGKWLKKQH